MIAQITQLMAVLTDGGMKNAIICIGRHVYLTSQKFKALKVIISTQCAYMVLCMYP